MTATATRNGQTKSRTYNPRKYRDAWLGVLHREEHARHAERVAAEAAEHAMSKPVGTGLKDPS